MSKTYVITFNNNIIQSMYKSFIRKKLESKGLTTHKPFRIQKGIGEGTFEKWRREFIKKNVFNYEIEVLEWTLYFKHL